MRIFTLLGLLITLSLGGVHAESVKVLRLAITTSTENSDSLNYLLPVFEHQSGYQVPAIAVGIGAALRMGRDGDVDMIERKPKRNADLNLEGANALINWMVSPAKQTQIGKSKIKGKGLFTPAARPTS